MTSAVDTAQAMALVEMLFGTPDAAARRAVAVLHAQAAALAWVRDTTGHYPAPKPVASALSRAAAALRDGTDDRDPAEVLPAIAADALGTFLAAAP
ncbi:hypothetical protein [Phytohabitans kaempferiae]|uniref:Uncharacterized protein n=1 Tax=Phytohabitans kaempferiae TaxID=1620943 RepID=A0ABV6M4R1_9ACTN